jgi:hypothetical protein
VRSQDQMEASAAWGTQYLLMLVPPRRVRECSAPIGDAEVFIYTAADLHHPLTPLEYREPWQRKKPNPGDWIPEMAKYEGHM